MDDVGPMRSASLSPPFLLLWSLQGKESKNLVGNVVVVMVMVVSSVALYSVPSFPLSMYINTDDVCHRRKQKTEGSGPRLQRPQSFGVEVDY